jgi:acetyl esterase/lipase
VRYAQRGYVVASITYRFADKFPFPACVQDAKCAVRFLRANADKYHIDKSRVAAIGGSAGGHLSMMLGYSSGVKELEGDGGYADQSSAVQVVVDLYGPTDITLPAARNNGTVKRFFGGKAYDEVPELYAQASPITHVTKNSPPTLIMQGTIDDTVPMTQSDLLYAKLKDLGVPVQYEKFDGYPHTMDIALEVNVRCQWFMNHFFDKYLKAQRLSP